MARYRLQAPSLCKQALLTLLPLQAWSNLNVMVEVERGFRLKAPKGCPRAIYKLMMASWNPHRRGRPNFDQLEEQMVLAYDMLFPAGMSVCFACLQACIFLRTACK